VVGQPGKPTESSEFSAQGRGRDRFGDGGGTVPSRRRIIKPLGHRMVELPATDQLSQAGHHVPEVNGRIDLVPLASRNHAEEKDRLAATGGFLNSP
jgi:hypothetical protein